MLKLTKIILIYFSILIHCHCQSSDNVETLPQHRYALLIGVDHYDDQAIGTLTDPINDVNELKGVLEEKAKFDVTVLKDDGNQAHLPTRTNILKALYKIRNNVPADGDALLLVMFSGHGMMSGGEGFLLPKDAAMSSDAGLLSDTSLSVSLLMKSMADTNANQTILIMDACRNVVTSQSHGTDEGQALTGAFESQFDFRTYNKSLTASLVLFATGIGDKALVDGATKLGYFSEVLIEGIRGAAADSMGNVTLASLIDYVQTEVPHRVSDNEGKFVQKPDAILRGYKAQKIVFSRGSATSAGSPSTVQDLAGSLTPKLLADSVHWYTKKHFNPDVDDRKNSSPQSLWLQLPQEKLAEIRSATYILHDKSFHPMYAVPDNSQHLAVYFTAYGCVDSATVVVELANGSSLASDFNECKKHQEDHELPEELVQQRKAYILSLGP